MKLNKFIILPFVLVLGACSSTYEPETDLSNNYDFDAIETFNVIGDEQLKNPIVSDINRERIDNAIENALIIQGKQESDLNNADVLISYFIVTRDRVKVTSTPTGHYGRYGRYNYIGAAHVSTRNYVEGTLVIDVIDNETKKAVWRSTLTEKLKNYDSPHEKDLAIQKAVNSMMKTLQYSQGIS